MSDNISNLITKIANASKTGKESIVFPCSKMSSAIAEALLRNGFFEAVAKKGKKSNLLEIKLAYNNDEPVIGGVKRISKFFKGTYS